MIELWFNGVLQGYFKIPNGFSSAREYADYYNSRQANYYPGCICAYAIAI